MYSQVIYVCPRPHLLPGSVCAQGPLGMLLLGINIYRDLVDHEGAHLCRLHVACMMYFAMYVNIV